MKKKFGAIILSALMIFSSTSVFAQEEKESKKIKQTDYFTVAKKNEKNFKSKNKKAETKFNSLKEENKKEKKKTNKKENNQYTGEFNNLNLIESNQENKTIYENKDNGVYDIIQYFPETESYVLIEISDDTDDIIFQVNDKNYIISSEKGINEKIDDIYMYNENGEKIPLVTYGEILKDEINENINNMDNITKPNSRAFLPFTYDYNILNGTFGKDYHVYNTTSTYWCNVLGWMSVATGGISLKVSNPYLGIFSFLTGAAATIGSSRSVTTYIKVYQAYSTNITSYVRERWDYYSVSNYTGFIKSGYRYFTS